MEPPSADSPPVKPPAKCDWCDKDAWFRLEIISAGYPAVVMLCQEHASFVLDHDYFVISCSYTSAGLRRSLSRQEGPGVFPALPSAPPPAANKEPLWQWMWSLIRRYARWPRH